MIVRNALVCFVHHKKIPYSKWLEDKIVILESGWSSVRRTLLTILPPPKCPASEIISLGATNIQRLAEGVSLAGHSVLLLRRSQ